MKKRQPSVFYILNIKNWKNKQQKNGCIGKLKEIILSLRWQEKEKEEGERKFFFFFSLKVKGRKVKKDGNWITVVFKCVWLRKNWQYNIKHFYLLT